MTGAAAACAAADVSGAAFLAAGFFTGAFLVVVLPASDGFSGVGAVLAAGAVVFNVVDDFAVLPTVLPVPVFAAAGFAALPFTGLVLAGTDLAGAAFTALAFPALPELLTA